MLNYKLHPKKDVKDEVGLHNYGFVTFPGGCYAPGVYYNKDTGKYLTGLDEFASDILTIKDAEVRKAKQAEIKAKREQIEAKLGQPDLLIATNHEFWDRFLIPINVEIDGTITIDGASDFDPENNPRHELMLVVAKANKLFAFGLEEANSPEYRNDKFFLSTEDEEDKVNQSNVKSERTRQVELSKLFDGDTKNYERAWEIAYYMGLKPKKKTSESSLELTLDTATKVNPRTRDQFLEACKLTQEDLVIANTFKKGVALNIVRVQTVENQKLYYRGGVNYRPTEEDSIKLLKMPEMITELTGLLEEVRKAESKRKHIA